MTRAGCAAASLFLAVLVSGCGPKPASDRAPAGPEARPVRVAEAVTLADRRQLRLPAALNSVARARLAFLQPGTLTERRVALGQSVAAGELLATVYNPALQPGVAAARARVGEAAARLEQLEIDTRRQQTLVERKLAAADTLDQVRTRRDAARATLEQARADLSEAENQLTEARLRAPFAGRVAEFLAEPGDFVATGQPVMVLFGADRLEAEIALPPALDPASIESVELLRTADGDRAAAAVADSGQAEPGRPRPLRIRAEPAAVAGWHSGEPVQVVLTFAGDERVVVPLVALVDPGTGSTRVFRVREGRAERVAVAAGRLIGESVVVTGPIEAGDLIVTAGQAQLLDGEAVRVLQ